MHLGSFRRYAGEIEETVAAELMAFFPDEMEWLVTHGARITVEGDVSGGWSAFASSEEDAWLDTMHDPLTRLGAIRTVMRVREDIRLFGFRDSDNPMLICYNNAPHAIQKAIDAFLPHYICVERGWDLTSFAEVARYPFARMGDTVIRVRTEQEAVVAALFG